MVEQSAPAVQSVSSGVEHSAPAARLVVSNVVQAASVTQQSGVKQSLSVAPAVGVFSPDPDSVFVLLCLLAIVLLGLFSVCIWIGRILCLGESLLCLPLTWTMIVMLARGVICLFPLGGTICLLFLFRASLSFVLFVSVPYGSLVLFSSHGFIRDYS